MNTATEESTASLVSSSDVNGTAVYSRDGTHIGSIDHLMIDKQSGRVGWAVMGFGGFLGLGEDYYPIPWAALHYDTARDGFVTDITEEQVKGAPERHESWHRDRTWERRAHEHYGAPLYWM
ncbi:PRC-barrel domain-containing protein [Vannielia litorea]|uniref:PRC-barrel domain-containing protein n=1 Tax=Vannielia litorea TaxID=1217970 RepID=A0A1N6FJ36_9RHOB|nr:PRC-barrel domain-containing protein [Vannielia litorea]SIN95255.1 PRC-barrel domain-containing protein [Vannielia litorea]